MKVLPSHTGEVTAGRSGQAASASTPEPTRSFASVLASSSTAATAPGTDVTPATTAPAATAPAATAPAATAPAATPAAISLRKGESMSAVNGHAYAEISGGKRDGLYVNTSNNKRRGQAFVLVHKRGREYHIYGTGKNRLVVALRKPERADTQKSASTDTPTNSAAGTGGITPTASAS